MARILGIIASSILQDTGDFESIATATGDGSSAYIDFTSIPSTYKHLQLRISGEPNNPGGGGATNVVIRMNSDTGTNYTVHYITGNGTGPSADGGASQTYIVLGNILQGSGSNIVNGLVVDILEYANTNKTKVLKSIGGVDKNGDGWTGIWAGSWQSTSAITSLRVYANDGLNLAWSTKSKLSLYGIKAAS
jgi:hypothetical protein